MRNLFNLLIRKQNVKVYEMKRKKLFLKVDVNPALTLKLICNILTGWASVSLRMKNCRFPRSTRNPFWAKHNDAFVLKYKIRMQMSVSCLVEKNWFNIVLKMKKPCYLFVIPSSIDLPCRFHRCRMSCQMYPVWNLLQGLFRNAFPKWRLCWQYLIFLCVSLKTFPGLG